MTKCNLRICLAGCFLFKTNFHIINWKRVSLVKCPNTWLDSNLKWLNAVALSLIKFIRRKNFLKIIFYGKKLLEQKRNKAKYMLRSIFRGRGLPSGYSSSLHWYFSFQQLLFTDHLKNLIEVQLYIFYLFVGQLPKNPTSGWMVQHKSS